MGFSSCVFTRSVCALHHVVCFCSQVEAFTSAGFLHRKGLQYHWRNRDRKTDDIAVNNNNHVEKTSAATAPPVPALSKSTTTATPSERSEQAETASGEGDSVTSSKKYADFDGYLGNFASKRRIKIRRERRSVYEDAGVSVTAYRGEDITDNMMETAFFIYKSTIDKMMYGRLYLNLNLFK
ncbi:unnamed protein product, partial [Hapterophycus canaliculatus]